MKDIPQMLFACKCSPCEHCHCKELCQCNSV